MTTGSRIRVGMNTEIKNAIEATEKETQYDEQVKRVLSNKKILSHILVNTIDEFKGMKPGEAEKYIEGKPRISIIPIEPGLTNSSGENNGERIVGLNTENSEINEGMIRFDIIFYVRMKDGISQVIVNIEAQKDEPTKYHILNRAIFYVCRLISSQKEKDFTGNNYDDIKRVYSIWICMNMKECLWNHIHLKDDKILGKYDWKGKLDLLNIVMLGLPKEVPPQDKRYELHRLLTSLMSMELTAEEKLDIMEKEYNVSVDNEIETEMNVMCNLGRGAVEYGIRKGIERGIEQGIERGIEQGEKRINLLNKKLREAGRLNDLFRSLDDEAYQEQLLKEYDL